MNWKKHLNKFNIFIFLAIVAGVLFFLQPKTYVADVKSEATVLGIAQVIPEPPPKPKHIETPKSVRAIYMTSWVAGTQKWREELVNFIKKSELNSLVIDVKDYTGRVSF